MAEVVDGIVGTVQIDDGNSVAQLAKLKASMDQVEKELYDLHDSFKLAGAGGQELTGRIEQLAAQQMRLKAQIAATEAGVASQTATMARQTQAASLNSDAFRSSVFAIDQYGTKMAHVQAGSSGAARGLLLLSQGIEDAQYGFSAIVNNVPMTLMAFGAGAGLAGAASIALVGINQLTKGMHDLSDVFLGAAAKTPVQVMEDLAKATKLTADQQSRLNDLKKEEAAFEALKNAPNKEEAKQKAAFDAATKDAGAGVVDGLRAAMKEEGVAAKMTPEEEAFIRIGRTGDKLKQDTSATGWLKEKVFGLLGFKDTAGAKQQVQSRLDELDDKAIMSMIGGASGDLGPSGDVMRQTLRKLVGDNPGMFPPGFLADVEGMDPAARKQQKEWEDAGAEYERKFQERVKAGTAPLSLADAKKERLDAMGLEAQYDAEEKAMAEARRAESYSKGGVDPFAVDPEGKGATPGMLEGALRAGADAQQDQDAAAKAGDQASNDAFARVQQMQEQNDLKEGQNDEKNDHFFRLKRIAERLGRQNFEAIRSSRTMDAAGLNASVQSSITNDNPMKRMLEEAKQSNLTLGELKQLIQKFSQPVRPGGR